MDMHVIVFRPSNFALGKGKHLIVIHTFEKLKKYISGIHGHFL